METNVTLNMPPPRFALAGLPNKCIGFFGTLGLGIALLVASAAGPQIGSPPPTLRGQAATHLFTVPGVISGGMETVFACTNVDSADIIVGVEVFGDEGGAAVNDASESSLMLAPGATALFSTSGSNFFVIDSELAPTSSFTPVNGGSARILATAKSGIICSAFLVAPPTPHIGNAPIPTSMVSLTVVKKTTQQGD